VDNSHCTQGEDYIFFMTIPIEFNLIFNICQLKLCLVERLLRDVRLRYCLQTHPNDDLPVIECKYERCD
jgi:hypothetical protein